MITHKEQRQHRYSWQIYTWPLTRNRDNIDIPDRHIHDHSQGTETTSIFLTHIYMTTHKEQRQHRYSWHTYTWPLTRNRYNIDIAYRLIHDHSQGTETTSIFLTHIYMTTHKEQRQHRYSWQTYTWPLTRNRDNIDIPDTYIHDHSQGTEPTSIFLTDIYMTTHKEQRQHRYSWHIYTWPLTMNRDYIDIPDRHIHEHSQGTETPPIFLTDIYMTTQQGTETTSIFLTDIYMTTQQGTETTSIFLTDIYMTTYKEQTTSIFLTHIYMTTHKEQRQHRYSWHIYTWPLTRNRDNIDIPDKHIYMTTHKEQRQHLYSWHIYTWPHNKEQRLHRYSWHTYTWPLTRNRQHRYSWHTYIWPFTRNRDTSIFLTHIYMTTHKEQRQHRYSWHTYTWPLTRNRDYIDIPDRHIHEHSQGTETPPIFLTDIYMTTQQGTETTSIFLTDIYMTTQQGTETTSIFLTDIYMTTYKEQTTSIFLTHIYMTTHKEQRQHRYSWHIYTWPLKRNIDNIDIPDTHIYMTTHKEQRQHLYSWHIYTWPHNKEQRLHRYSWHTYTWPLTRNRDNIYIPDTHIYDHSQGTETTSIFLTHIYMTTHKEQRLHRYSWHTYTWSLARNRDNIDIPDTHIHDHSQGTEKTSIFVTHIYKTTHKEQRLHRYSWHTYTWPLTRNRDNIDIPDTYIHDHSQGTETTSIFLTDIYMTTHKEQRQHRYSWHIYTWPLTRNRDNIDIPDRHIHDHSQGTETTSIFLTDIYMTTHKEQRQHRYSWHTYIHDHSQGTETTSIFLTHIYMTTQQGTETTSIFLTHIYMTTHKEQRHHRYSWHTYTHDHSQGIEITSIFLTDIYMTTHKEQRQHRYSWQTYTWPLTRNRDNIDIPDRHIHDHSQGTETTSIFLTDIYMTTHKEQTTSIFLTHIYMTTHKEQRLHRYSWHTYTWPLTRNRDNIDIPDRHIHDHSQGTETTSIFLTHIYMTTYKEQRQHRYSWHTYTCLLTRNRDNIDIPDTHIHDHSQGTETTSIFLTHIYMTTHKEQRQHRYSWQIYTWPLTRNIDNIDIPDRHIHDHSQGTETTSIFLTHIYITTQQGTETTSIFLTDIYMTTHKEQRQHRYSWHTYT